MCQTSLKMALLLHKVGLVKTEVPTTVRVKLAILAYLGFWMIYRTPPSGNFRKKIVLLGKDNCQSEYWYLQGGQKAPSMQKMRALRPQIEILVCRAFSCLECCRTVYIVYTVLTSDTAKSVIDFVLCTPFQWCLQVLAVAIWPLGFVYTFCRLCLHLSRRCLELV